MRISATGIATVAAVAATMVGGTPARAAERASSTPKGIVRTFTDPATGIGVRIQQSRPGDVAVEVGDRTVSVRRELTRDQLRTTVKAGRESVTFVLDRKGLSVTSGARRVVVSADHPDGAAQVASLLRGSRALGQAAALLERVHLGAASPVGQTLTLTRAFLLSAAGRGDEAAAVLGHARAALQVTAITPARFGPDECWNEYAKEAIAAYQEYEDCVNNKAWYDVIGVAECAAIYDMRAIGAFSWWVSCVGLRGSDV